MQIRTLPTEEGSFFIFSWNRHLSVFITYKRKGGFIMKNLNQLEIGCVGRIISICSSGSIRRRMLDMGFVQGADVQCILEPPSGDPRAYLIKNTVVALRRTDAEHILIQKGENL